MNWWDYIVIPGPLLVLLLLRLILVKFGFDPWPGNKDFPRDVIGAITLGLALSAFIRTEEALTTAPVFRYDCRWSEKTLEVTQLGQRRLQRTFLVIEPDIVDSSGDNPPVPMLANRPKPVDFNLDPQLPEPLKLLEVLDQAYPKLHKWLTEHTDHRVTKVTLSIRYGPTPDVGPESRTVTRECR